VFDYELDNVTIDFKTGNAAKFIDFDEEMLTMTIKEGTTSNSTQPVF
jgi:hypothetical protein